LINFVFWTLLLNPYFKVLPISAETQPVVVLLFLFSFILGKSRINKNTFFYVCALVAIWILLGLRGSLVGIFPFLVGPLIYDLSSQLRINKKAIKVIIGIWFVISVNQYFNLPFLKVTGLSDLFEVLIPRWKDYKLAQWGNRGVQGLTPEPSYMAHGLFVIFSLSVVTKQYKNLLFILLMFLMNSSGTALIYIGLIIVGSLWFVYRRWIIVAAPLVILAVVLISNPKGSRMQKVVYHGLNSINSGQVMDVATTLGSTREFSVGVAYSSAKNNLLGVGFGNARERFLESMEEAGFDGSMVSRFQREGEIGLKPYAYGALLLYEGGIIAFAILICYLFVSLNLKHMEKIEIVFSIICIIMIFFHSTVTQPAFWTLLGILNRKNKIYEKHGMVS
jgi:hypothetical protein